jgi:hypothetical protein
MRTTLRVIFITCAFLFHFENESLGQDINWSMEPRKGFVFQISNKEAQKLLTHFRPDTIFRGLLHTQVDTFDVKKGWLNRPAKGHFILAAIKGNKLHCDYISVFPYQVFLLKEYDALALQVVDMDGNVREDAKVKFKARRLRIDPESKTYRVENGWTFGSNKIVTVELDGFRSIFNIQKNDVPEWQGNYSWDDGPAFYSYMITDKNKYKPGEKVRFKSYALSHFRSPLRKELEVVLSGREGQDRIVGHIQPHRPGSYASEFQLHDSMKLTLDRQYQLSLREKKGRIVAQCNFKYEDYELDGNRLEVKLATDKQFHPASNELSIIATDVNGLMLKDAKATVAIMPQNIRETFQPLTILRDTLFITQIDLNTSEPATIQIPSALFQKTNTSYDVVVTLLNSQNQRLEKSVRATHYYAQYELTSRFSNDSIVYELLDNGVAVAGAPASVKHDDEVMPSQVVLPYKEKLNPVIGTVTVNSKSIFREFTMKNCLPEIEIQGGIALDSFKIKLYNPQKLGVSWYIYQGSTLLQKKFGNEMDFKSFITDRTETFYVELLYSFGGEDQIKRKSFEFRDERLNVSLDIPARAYPGQKVDATIHVTDQVGQPVSGVDLTAFAVNGKLDYYVPDLPYYGSGSSSRSMKASYTKYKLDKRTAILQLDYAPWMKPAGLDTMMYYRFTYPGKKMFRYSINISDSTQFAPFVMQNGVAEIIYVVELNREPVYFSWTDQPAQYSFYASPRRSNEVSLRLFDRVLVIDSLYFEAGKKTILSIDLDHLPAGVKIYKIDKPRRKNKYDRPFFQFTETEKSRYMKYLSSFKRASGDAYLETQAHFTPLFRWNDVPANNKVVVGPVMAGKKTYVGITDNVRTTYNHVGGYHYVFEDNIVYKQDADRVLPDRLLGGTFVPMTRASDRVLTKKEFLKPRSYDSQWHPRILDLVDNSMRIKILLPDEKARSGAATLVFENCKTKQVVSPCPSRYSTNPDFLNITKGLYNVIIIYNNGAYLKMDSVELSAFTKIVVDLNTVKLQQENENSKRWRLLGASVNCYQEPTTRVIRMRRAVAVNGNVRGTITSADDNAPLPGVNVVVKDTEIGTVTDENGTFALDVKTDITTLVISFIGMQTKELEVHVGSVVSVAMVSDVKQLSEVVVVAYGSRSVNRFASSVSYLNGSVAGVQITPDIVERDQMPDTLAQKESEKQLYRELMVLNSIRSKFSDVGFWEPKLFTDKCGESKFTITYPDDLTRWEATVYAMNRRLQTGTGRKQIKSYKPIVAELHVPQFLTRGDSSNLIGKILNYSDDKVIAGKVKWDGGSSSFEKPVTLSELHTDRLPFRVATTDSVKARYVFARDDGYVDGEERNVPVVEQGVERAEGELRVLNNNDEVHVTASPGESTTVELLASQLDVYAGEARYLLNYKYDCNEQLASKLIGLINYRLLMKFEEKPFRYDKDVQKIITRLLKNQNETFLWSWWDVSPSTNFWMSAHILRALKQANDAGYQVDLNIDNIRRKAEYRFDIEAEIELEDADLLQALATWDVRLDYHKYVRNLDSLIVLSEKRAAKAHRQYSQLGKKLLLQEVRQLSGLTFQKDSLLHYQKRGILGEIHFSDEKNPDQWYYDELTVNAIAYRIVKRDSSLRELRGPMQMYFLSQRQNAAWNTYHTSNVLSAVMPDLITAGATKDRKASVAVSGSRNMTIEKFPFQLELTGGEEVLIHKNRGLPVYLLSYKKERVTEAKVGGDGFEIKTYFSNANQSALEAGVPATLTVEVNVKKDARAEYVMIEVPIPGACSYADKTQQRNFLETHREYYKDRTVIFCENLKAGKYVFDIDLLPRFTGKYFVNPAQVSLMYVPVVNANTEMKSVVVK